MTYVLVDQVRNLNIVTEDVNLRLERAFFIRCIMETFLINKYMLEFKTKLLELKKSINYEELKSEINELDKTISDPNIWSDSKNAENLISHTNELKNKLNNYNELTSLYDEILEFIELSHELEGLEKEIEDKILDLSKKINEFETIILMDDLYDDYNAILEIHPGAGGTEALDWCDMLFRMYQNFAKKHNLKLNVLSFESGEVGLKSVSCEISGKNAYGLLKSERGVHRLVRISPFDSNKRRHTTFASVDVAPLIKNDLDIVIKDEDIRIDTYLSSGHGGQGVNTTYSAVRITYLPLNIVVTCQNERSQLRNKESAMMVLKSKLLEIELLKQELNLKEIKGEQLQNGFGSQIRSYVFCPYTMVKEHRTNFETSFVEDVLNGRLEDFIRSYLVMKASEKNAQKNN